MPNSSLTSEELQHFLKPLQDRIKQFETNHRGADKDNEELRAKVEEQGPWIGELERVLAAPDLR